MAYLDGWHRVVTRGDIPGWAVLLDHGPLYRLAQLTEGTPRPALARWCDGLLARWLRTLDVLVWLEAPIATLSDRVRIRERWHVLKDHPPEVWAGLLAGHRNRLDALADRVAKDGHATLLRFDTADRRPGEIAEEVRRSLEARRAGMTV